MEGDGGALQIAIAEAQMPMLSTPMSTGSIKIEFVAN